MHQILRETIMTRTIYNYHPETGEIINESPADESPLEPGVILIPSFASAIKPPNTAIREVAVFADAQWQVKVDWRGVKLFSTYDGSSVSIEEIGKTPSDVSATELPRPGPAHAWKDDAWVIDPSLQAELAAQEQAALIKRYEGALDAHLDSVAHTHRYTDRFTFALRAGYPGPYQAEGVAYAQWMDACNVQAFSLLQRVLSGQEALPSLEAFIGALPTFKNEAA
jgi:hypothetical protein